MLNFREYRRDAGENGEIINTGETHLPCVLLIDTSGSMSSSLERLHDGLQQLGAAIQGDPKASGIVEISIITFDDKCHNVMPFGPTYDFVAPVLTCGGMTAGHAAIDAALTEIEIRKEQYKAAHTGYYRPWIFMLTDGGFNDPDNGAIKRLISAQENRKCVFFPCGIGESVDYDMLSRLSTVGGTIKATRENFENAFIWLSASMSTTSDVRTGQRVSLPDPRDFQLEIIA